MYMDYLCQMLPLAVGPPSVVSGRLGVHVPAEVDMNTAATLCAFQLWWLGSKFLVDNAACSI